MKCFDGLEQESAEPLTNSSMDVIEDQFACPWSDMDFALRFYLVDDMRPFPLWNRIPNAVSVASLGQPASCFFLSIFPASA